MRINGLVLAAASLLAISAYAADNQGTSKGDNEKLQGKWRIMSIAAQDTVIKREGGQGIWKGAFENDMFVKGDRIGQVGHSNAKIKLDGTREPKQITIQDEDGKLTFRGIYVLDGDTMKVCMNGDGTDVRRPEEFVTKKGTPLILVTLKKCLAEE